MQERIKKLMTHYQLSASELAQKLEVGKPLISHILSGRNNPSVMVLEKLAIKFERLNLNWLVTGKGEMLRNDLEEKQTNGKLPLMQDDIEEETPAPYNSFKVQTDHEQKVEVPTDEHSPPAIAGAEELKVNNSPNVSKIIVVGNNGSVTLFSPEKQ